MVLRILTANLYNGRARPASFAKLLDSTMPDVVAVQELAPNAAEVLRPRYPAGLSHPASDCTGIALVSRHPMDVVRRRLPHRDGMKGTLETGGPDGASLHIWSVHLANPVDLPPPIRRRRSQVHRLASEVAGTYPVVVVGDLNATPSWPAHRRLLRHLEDGVAEWAESRGRRPSRTWAPYPRWPALLRIDHVLVRGVRVVGARTHRIAGADHRAVIVDVDVGLSGDQGVEGFE